MKTNRNEVYYDINKPMYIVYVGHDAIFVDNIFLAWQTYRSMRDAYKGTISICLVDGQTGEVIEDNEDDE